MNNEVYEAKREMKKLARAKKWLRNRKRWAADPVYQRRQEERKQRLMNNYDRANQ